MATQKPQQTPATLAADLARRGGPKHPSIAERKATVERLQSPPRTPYTSPTNTGLQQHLSSLPRPVSAQPMQRPTGLGAPRQPSYNPLPQNPRPQMPSAPMGPPRQPSYNPSPQSPYGPQPRPAMGGQPPMQRPMPQGAQPMGNETFNSLVKLLSSVYGGQGQPSANPWAQQQWEEPEQRATTDPRTWGNALWNMSPWGR
jgi:hypothetical protein